MALLRTTRTLGGAAAVMCATTLVAVPAWGAGAECRCWRYVRPEGRPPDAAFTDITAPSRTSAWSVGHRGGKPFAMAWNGSRWRETTVPMPADTTLEGVSASAKRDAWVVGAARSGTAHVAHWNGRWTPGTLPGARPAVPRAVHARTADDAWIAGSSGGRAALWHWDGTGWALAPITGLGAAGSRLRSVEARAADDAWAVGTTGSRQLLLHWDGRTWTPLPGPESTGATSLADVAAPRPNEAWAVGTARSDGPDPSPLVQRWDGLVWKTVPVPGLRGGFTSVTSDGARGVWAGGEDDQGRPVLARWNGRRWDVSRPPVPDPSGDDPGDGPASIGGLARVPGSTHVQAAGSYGRPHDPLRHAITWTNHPRPR